MSPHQRKTAVRVANVPEEKFEAAVENHRDVAAKGWRTTEEIKCDSAGQQRWARRL